MTWSGKKILITGASGFLARYLVGYLSSDEKSKRSEIIGLVRQETPLNTSMLIYNNIDTLIQEQKYFDIIFHLAAFIPRGTRNEADLRYQKDIELTLKLCTAYTDAHIVYTSSVAVYGQILAVPVSFASPFNLPDYYAMSKLASEAIVQNQKTYSIIRFSSIIGPAMPPVSFVPRIIQSAKEKGKITLYGNGTRTQDYIDVRDAAQLCWHCSEQTSNVRILGVRGKSVSNLQVAQMVQESTKCEILFVDAEEGDSFSYNEKDGSTQIGYNLKYSLEQTIIDMIGQ